ncbi:unnamed protein product [Polarella glacialis]|uniref:Ubiquitin-like domain-containing protein n=1 Tax=Polarella glacialis TaxID=89957 RepID=A0A813KZS2_POLGL|nr:unnamed protein product [Polarella glacialis]CAE8719624.1 unnamed protein product [Polarella glacialis]
MAQLQLPVRLVDGTQLLLSGLSASSSLEDLMEEIASRFEIPKNEQKLVLDSVVIPTAQPSASLESLGIGASAVITLVRVGLPQKGVWTGTSSYRTLPAGACWVYEVQLDSSSWRWLDLPSGTLEIQMLYKVLRSPRSEAVGFRGIEVLEGRYDWEQARLVAGGVFLKPWAGEARSCTEKRPQYVSMPARDIVAACFQLCKSSHGRVSCRSLRRVAEYCNYEGSEEEWQEEYVAQCEHFECSAADGLDAAQFGEYIEMQELDDDGLQVLMAGLEWEALGQKGPNLHRIMSLTPYLEIHFQDDVALCRERKSADEADECVEYRLRRSSSNIFSN